MIILTPHKLAMLAKVRRKNLELSQGPTGSLVGLK